MTKIDFDSLSPSDKIKVAEVALGAVVAFAKESMRWAMGINGGAATALIAFLPSASEAGLKAASLATALVAFGWGTCFGAAAFGLSYLAQVSDLEGLGSSRSGKLFQAFRGLAVLLVVAAFASFLVGIYSAADAVRNSS